MISVIIPTYNEGQRVVRVVEAVKGARFKKEILVVDDGSNVDSQKILDKIAGIKRVRHEKNKGKTQALCTGIAKAKYARLLFLDADLDQLQSIDIEKLVKRDSLSDSDMTLGLRGRPNGVSGVTGFSYAFTGERILQKSFFTKYPDILELQAFLIEPAINKILFRKKVQGVVMRSAQSTWKYKKHGIMGIWGDTKLIIDYIFFLGPKEFLYQLNFAKKLHEQSR